MKESMYNFTLDKEPRKQIYEFREQQSVQYTSNCQFKTFDYLFSKSKLFIKVNQQSMQGEIDAFLFLEEPLKQIYPEYSHKSLLKMLNSETVDRALGCLFGSFIGDALGSYLEFLQKPINDELLNKAMNMPQGGYFNLKSGQVTDDSQMAFHLLKALLDFDPIQPLEFQVDNIIAKICQGYVSWKNSHPFDIGITCKSGIDQIQKRLQDIMNQPLKLEKNLNQLQKDVYEVNNKSQSNGSLMRIAPLSFFCALYPKSNQPSKEMTNIQLKKLISTQIKLIHSNIMIVESSLIWSLALRTIINRNNNEELKEIYQKTLLYAKSKGLATWVAAVEQEKPLNGIQNMGWAKIAWSYGFRCLKYIASLKGQKLGSDLYKYCIKQILSRGGDTDTNAAICGGMLGAIVGFKQLPKKYLYHMMTLTFPPKPKHMNERPAMYEPRHAFIDAYKMIEKFVKKEKKQNVCRL